MNDRTGFLSDSDFVLRCQRSRRYKSQIRDIVTTCRTTGRRKSASETHGYSPIFQDPAGTTHAASVSGYQNATVYPYADNMNGLSSYAAAKAAMPPRPQNIFSAIDHNSSTILTASPQPLPPRTQSLFSTSIDHNPPSILAASPQPLPPRPQNIFSTAIDHNSRSILAPENFLHYSRHALGYYPDYHHPAAQYPSNGFLDHMAATRTAHCFPGYASDTSYATLSKESPDKFYACQFNSQFNTSSESKYNGWITLN